MHTVTSNTNTVEYDATQNAVASVTVYQSDRAEVKRNIKVNLKDGQNDVEVKNLPTCLDESSIRVDGEGNAVIFDVIYHPPANGEINQDVTEDLVAQRSVLQEQLAILKRQSEILQEYSKTLTGKDASTDQLESFLDVYSKRQAGLDEKKRELTKEIRRIDNEIQEARRKVHADAESVRKRGVRVTIIVLAPGEGEAELSLTYVVTNARWTPHYDLRATIARNASEGPETGKAVETAAEATSSVELHYRASISQSTGEDWTGVELTLSTASPLQGTAIPKLEPMWVNQRSPLPRYHAPPASAAPPAWMHPESWAMRTAPDDRVEALEDNLLGASPEMSHVQAGVNSNVVARRRGGMRAQATETAEGAVSATFTIPGLSTIPSDSDGSQQTHKVSIAELEFNSVEIEWISVPKKIASAFLKCKIKNTTKYVLLSGEANVFMNNSFVAKSRIPHVSPLEHFACSLGVDPALKVTYHSPSKKTRSTGGTFLSGAKHTITTCEQRATIRNTRTTHVHRVRVRDQIPVSRDTRIKVTLLEPKSLAQSVGGSLTMTSAMIGSGNGPAGYPVAEGVRVRWLPLKEWTDDEILADGSNATIANPDGSLEASAESAQGLFEWICEIDAGASVDVALVYEISVPAGMHWTQYT